MSLHKGANYASSVQAIALSSLLAGGRSFPDIRHSREVVRVACSWPRKPGLDAFR